MIKIKKIKEYIINNKRITLLITILFFIGILFYEQIFFVDKNENNYREKIYVINKKQWCKNQKQYFPEDSDFYPITVTSQKHKHTDTETITRDGYVYYNKKAKANILLCHGYMISKEDMNILRFLLNEYNIISFDFRAHGENIASQYCTLGCHEKYDVMAFANYIKNEEKLKNLPLFVYGFSMGAVASILAQSESKDLFVGAIWDCPFQSTNYLTEMALKNIKWIINGYNIDIPIKKIIQKYIYNKSTQASIQYVLKLFTTLDSTGINTCIKNISPINALSHIDIPFLLIGCFNDDKAPADSILSMYKNHAQNTYARCWISSGRRHFDSFFLHPEQYIYEIKKFINLVLDKKHLNKEKELFIDENCFLVHEKN
jgi:esterase/lipase